MVVWNRLARGHRNSPDPRRIVGGSGTRCAITVERVDATSLECRFLRAFIVRPHASMRLSPHECTRVRATPTMPATGSRRDGRYPAVSGCSPDIGRGADRPARPRSGVYNNQLSWHRGKSGQRSDVGHRIGSVHRWIPGGAVHKVGSSSRDYLISTVDGVVGAGDRHLGPRSWWRGFRAVDADR